MLKTLKLKRLFADTAGPFSKNTKDGKFVRIKLKAFENIYRGDIYITDASGRVSDIVNDERRFISLIETTRETDIDEVEIGYLAINKSVVEWICIEKEKPDDSGEGPIISHSIY